MVVGRDKGGFVIFLATALLLIFFAHCCIRLGPCPFFSVLLKPPGMLKKFYGLGSFCRKEFIKKHPLTQSIPALGHLIHQCSFLVFILLLELKIFFNLFFVFGFKTTIIVLLLTSHVNTETLLNLFGKSVYPINSRTELPVVLLYTQNIKKDFLK